ncbi:RNA polymerase II subunit A C-terminal domain phosphatase [Mycena indigotica]|uniref:RNA polymerase II subunit A C-terminal domain phosphatase n=1 Tax=Mycena indigotica TaxID=2126181 RepID=A0A8H6SYH9_9AGAR|nr:RNA polymerase II subunit A C-terminal domain phosphatase [Mycena indigotica]KAF7307500.1 RNA polymerase II subunit A C-terminal domain phosphatase [Mycena indigotica]
MNDNLVTAYKITLSTSRLPSTSTWNAPMADSEPTPTDLFLPPSFPFPIKVISIDANSQIKRGTRLLTYSFVHVPAQRNAQPESRFGTWDSAIEGNIVNWTVTVGDVISARKAREQPVVLVLEECKHGMQVGGMCVVCGRDMTVADYIGFADSSRANIQMTHSANGPTVSLEEAERIERENIQELLQARKLTLIVDLDQTIVHATVDPTVGEWKADGAAWKARHVDKPDENPDDICNPNWDALEDVAEFKLKNDSFSKTPEHEGPTYYIKRRPGWQKFLQDMSLKYQMHVYTMGTRAYAEEVCALIDPKGDIFGRRLLSRDESNNMTRKSLERLFPCDTSMVVVIDDRADVWEWIPNLLKVVPFDFFVGIGDINGTFLPKNNILGPGKPEKPAAKPKGLAPGGDPEPPPDPDATTAAANQAKLAEKALIQENTIALEAQVEERPLAKKQEELQHPTPETTRPMTAALLKDDDNELVRIRQLLEEVHQEFYTVYERSSHETLPPPPATSRRNGPTKPKPPYDVTEIMLRKRAQVLAGVHLVFSGVIPLDTNPQTSEHWRLARMFGAKCSTELTPETTHLVCAKPGTVKADTAMRRGGIYVIRSEWFADCLNLLARQDETRYLLEGVRAPIPTVGVSANPSSTAAPTTIEKEDEDEEWDESRPADGSLALDAINWDDINDEVDAAMNESDDEDGGKSERSVMSEDEWDRDNSSAPGTPSRGKRKRLRSVTPSEGGSPLSKRKKLTGASKLKEGVTADDLSTAAFKKLPPITTEGLPPTVASLASNVSDGEDDSGEEEDDDDGDDEEDDFLARELEEDWG